MKKKFSKRLLALLLIFLLAFTIACLVIPCIFPGVYISDTLIACVFGFCGVEGGLLAWIKNTDTKTSTKNKGE